MTNRTPKARVIYDNYDPCETYTDDDLIEMARECEWVNEDEEITDDMLWKWRYEEVANDWDNEAYELSRFWENKTAVFLGSVGLWHGVYTIKPEEGKWWQLFYKAIEDCDYWRIYDENGHMYLTCSHHDGTNHFEIKMKPEGKRYYVLPRYAETVYGSKAREWEPLTKANIVAKLNNEASSFYSA